MIEFRAFLFFWGYPKLISLAHTPKVKGAGVVTSLNG